mgnify:CR=1 FL=1
MSNTLIMIWSPFLESPKTFWAHFGWLNSLCIFKVKASQGTKLCSYFNCYSLYNLWKDQLYRISGSQLYEWLFGPEKFSGLWRYGPLISCSPVILDRSTCSQGLWLLGITAKVSLTFFKSVSQFDNVLIVSQMLKIDETRSCIKHARSLPDQWNS